MRDTSGAHAASAALAPVRPSRRLAIFGCAVALAGLCAPTAATARTARPHAPSRQSLQVVLPLTIDSAGLRSFALSVSTPGSPLYGEYEPVSTLAQRFGATAATRRRVLRFLRAGGASAVSVDATGELAKATVTAAVADHLFDVRLERFRTADGVHFIAPAHGQATAASLAIPGALRGAVTGVIGLDTRPILDAALSVRRARTTRDTSSQLRRTGTPSGCPAAVASGGLTPNQYDTAYGFSALQAGGNAGQGQRVALVEISGFKPSDIQTFAHCFGLPLPPLTPHHVGLHHDLPPGGETTLDLEVLDATAPQLSGIDVYESGPSPADVLQDFSAPLQNAATRPQVISSSIGLCERETLLSGGAALIGASENALATASAAGITVLSASGDNGAADCLQDGHSVRQLAVDYPSSSWWVTGVGGTNIELNAANQRVAERVWNDEFGGYAGAAGGGGASDLFPRPPYQDGVVKGPAREVPDVSMLADPVPGYAIYCTALRTCVNGQDSDVWQQTGGTSAAAPLLAGGFALVDHALQAAGHEDLGLVNPLLYELGSATTPTGVFSDITAFGNDVGPFIRGDHRLLGCCTATPGYDDASGWGSVNLAPLAAQAIAQVPSTVTVSLALAPGQHPFRAHQLVATVTCTGACTVEAYADITLGDRALFAAHSSKVNLAAAGSAQVPVVFSGNQRRRLRSALGDGDRVIMDVVAASFDTTGHLVANSAGQRYVVRN